MKKLILTALTCMACVAAFAQGRIQFVNDSLHLVYYNFDEGTLSGQPVWAGTSGPGGMPAGYNLVTDFYLGTSSSSLSLISTTTFSATAPGKFNLFNYQWNGVPGGTTVYVMIQVRDSLGAAESTWTGPLTGAQQAQQGFSYYGASSEFSFVLGTSTTIYPPMVATGSLLGGGFSTWPVGTYNMDFLSPGSRGAIAVGIPEPTSLALAGLAATAMLLFRRRNMQSPYASRYFQQAVPCTVNKFEKLHPAGINL